MDIFSKIWGLTKEEADEYLQKGIVNVRTYERSQIILGMNGEAEGMGIVLSGTALLEGMNLDEQRRVLDYYEADDMFGRYVIPGLGKGMSYVVCKAKCRVAFLEEKKLLAEKREEGGRWLLEKMAQAHRKLLVHADILGQRCLRQKLCAFFGYLSAKQGTESFVLPFSLTDCADFLAADRSAMMRELGKMKEEGLVEARGRQIRYHRLERV